MIYVPVPLHRWRLLRQRFNQAAVLAQQMARIDGSEICVDMLHRMKTTAIKNARAERNVLPISVSQLFSTKRIRAD